MNAPTPSNRQGMRPPAGPAAPQTSMRLSVDFRSKIKVGQPKLPPRIFLYGTEKIGKSTAGAEAPNPVFLCSEDGLVGSQFANTPNFSASTWEEAMAFADYLATEDHGYQFFVTDTLDWLQVKLFEFLCRRDQKESIEDYGFGKGYDRAAEEFRGFLAKLDRINKRGIGILILAHSHVKGFQNPTGDNYDRYEPKVNPKISGLVKEWADAVLFAEAKVYTHKASKNSKAKAIGGDVHIVHTKKAPGWDAGNRYGLPHEMELDMPSILEAIANGNGAGGDSPDAIIEDIRALAAGMPDDKIQKIEAAINEAGADAAALARVLNKTRVTANKLASELQENTTNG